MVRNSLSKALLRPNWPHTLTLSSGLWLVMAIHAAAVEPQRSHETNDQFLAVGDLSSDRLDASMSQVTSVSQLSDVEPTEWAFQALKSLVERYGCIVGYPDRTFRGNRAMTRWEFAAGLNACLDKIQELIAAATADFIKREDLETVKRLQEAFAAELAALRGRVDALEVRTAMLEKQQFSTTTKLYGEAAFSISSAFGDRKAGGSGEPLDDNPVFDYRARLFFNTSFTGKDRLVTRLDALNTIPFGPGGEGFPNVTGTNMTRLAFDEGTAGSVRIGKLFYSFGLGKSAQAEEDDEDHAESAHGHGHDSDSRFTFFIDAIGGEFNENVPNFNEFFSEELTGAISRFGRFNPIYYQGLEGTGATVNYQLSDALVLSAGYMAPNANSPNLKAGLFNGAFAALAQLTLQPNERFQAGFTYVRSYFPGGDVVVSGETGSEFANEPFGEVATAADNFGFQTSIRVSPKFTFSGWAGFTRAYAKASDAEVQRGDDATIFNWAATLAFPDLGKAGNLLGVIVGQPPKVTSNDVRDRRDGTTAFHLELLYRYQVTDNISITPGFLAVFNPNHNRSNDPIYIGTIKTIFQF